MEGIAQVVSFVSHPEQVEERVDGGKYKGNNCSSSTDSTERSLFCLVSHVGKLQSAGKYQGEKLIEDDRVEIEIRSSVEGDF